MNKLEKLIVELCPNGVEYKKIEECCEILDTQRKPIPKGARESGQYPYYGANGIQDYVSDYIFDGTFILIGEDGSVITSKGNPVVNWVSGKIWVNNHAHVLKEKSVLLRFIYHFIQIVDISDLVHGNIPKLTQGDLRNIEVPVPPLPIQEEIVKILDNFTELTAELTAELQDRKKQYEYYRDSLLTFNNDYKKIHLVDVGKVCMCKRILKEQTSSIGDVPFYKIGTFGKEPDAFITRELFEEYKNKYSYPKKGEILISCSGTIGRTVVFDGKDAYFQDSNIVWISNDETIVLNSYLYYVYQLNPFKVSTGGTISRLYNEGIEKAEIIIPPLEIQERIVSVLDNFEKICNDLKIGLPAEIELRQKQYEYYRDLLLTFPENDLCLSKQA